LFSPSAKIIVFAQVKFTSALEICPEIGEKSTNPERGRTQNSPLTDFQRSWPHHEDHVQLGATHKSNAQFVVFIHVQREECGIMAAPDAIAHGSTEGVMELLIFYWEIMFLQH